MRKKLFILFSFGICGNINGQFIQNMSISPLNPTDITPISIVVNEYFPSAGCALDSKSFTFNGSTINASSIHCLGILTVICANADTFQLGLLNPGTYKFIMRLQSGSSPSPCSNSVGPSIIDSLIFTVTSATNIETNRKSDGSFLYNSATQSIEIDKGLSDYIFEIWDLNGQLINKAMIYQQNYTFDCRYLKPSIYLAILRNETERRLLKFRMLSN